MTTRNQKTAAPKVTTSDVTRAIETAFGKFTRASVAALAAGQKAADTLIAEIAAAATKAGAMDEKGYIKLIKPTVDAGIDKAVKAQAISKESGAVYATRLKVYFLGHANGITLKGQVTPGLRAYYDHAKPILADKKVLSAGGNKGAGRKADPKPETQAPSAPGAKKPEPLQGVVLSPKTASREEVKTAYLSAAAYLIGDTYAPILCQLIADDKERLTKMLDAYAAETLEVLKVAAE